MIVDLLYDDNGPPVTECEIANRTKTYMMYSLCIFLVSDYIQSRVSQGFIQRIRNVLMVESNCAPCVTACATFVTASPVAAANSDGSSESLDK